MLYLTENGSKDSDRMADSVDSGQTVPLGARRSLIRVYTICPELSVRTLRIFTVFGLKDFGKVCTRFVQLLRILLKISSSSELLSLVILIEIKSQSASDLSAYN